MSTTFVTARRGVAVLARLAHIGKSALDTCRDLPAVIRERRSEVPPELTRLIDSPEHQQHQVLQPIAEHYGLQVCHCEMPNRQLGWLIDGVTPEMVGDPRLRETLRKLAQSAQDHATTVFIAVANVTFGIDSAPVDGRAGRDQRLRDWLIDDLGWHSLGNTEVGWGELIGP